MDKDTGGAAFPDPGRAQSAKQRESLTDTGMTLRDYFAAKALPSLMDSSIDDFMAARKPNETADMLLARLAYGLADAMLAERAK